MCVCAFVKMDRLEHPPPALPVQKEILEQTNKSMCVLQEVNKLMSLVNLASDFSTPMGVFVNPQARQVTWPIAYDKIKKILTKKK